MGGGTERAERDATTRGWERLRMTGTALAVTALAVLGALLGAEESRSGAHVAFGRASVAQPSGADTGAGQRGRAIDPVGGKENRQVHTSLCTPARRYGAFKLELFSLS